MMVCLRWVVGNSYRVSFSHDPMMQKGGGLLGAFVPVRGSIFLTDDAEMVRIRCKRQC